jgi:hypothetical protein
MEYLASMPMDIEQFDFDEWTTLARLAPDTFEFRRRERIERLIYGHSHDHETIRCLSELQGRIDIERIRSLTSLEACLRIYFLMCDSYLDYQGAIENLVCHCGRYGRAGQHQRK